MKKLLIIGHTFPEPATTAAGNRMMQLISVFQDEGYKIIFGSTARTSEKTVDLSSLGVITEILQLNHTSFDTFITQLNPTIVLFDRYITEEQFGWRVIQHCPQALRILDTEDLHFLRKARQEAYKKTRDIFQVNLYSDTAKRELASILRCDLSLIISKYEIELLTKTFAIPEAILRYVPFMVEKKSIQYTSPSFKNRDGFMTIGNLLHAPNVDSVLFLKKEIWPKIKQQIPQTTLSIYGNYAPQQITQLHDEKEGFLIKGWAPSVAVAMQQAKICVAPLRFGAGLKGKLLDAMLYGTPAITTTIGAEGMYGDLKHTGGIGDTVDTFVENAVSLYQDAKAWHSYQQRGFKVLENYYLKNEISETLRYNISYLLNNLSLHRTSHFVGQILQHQSLQATKYMSKWIEEKNK